MPRSRARSDDAASAITIEALAPPRPRSVTTTTGKRPASPRRGGVATAGKSPRILIQSHPFPSQDPSAVRNHDLFQINHGHTAGKMSPGLFFYPWPSPVPVKESKGQQHPVGPGAREGIPRTSATFKNKVLFYYFFPHLLKKS